jgi:hypothetical protein
MRMFACVLIQRDKILSIVKNGTKVNFFKSINVNEKKNLNENL